MTIVVALPAPTSKPGFGAIRDRPIRLFCSDRLCSDRRDPLDRHAVLLKTSHERIRHRYAASSARFFAISASQRSPLASSLSLL
jgi:hypothetical protein